MAFRSSREMEPVKVSGGSLGAIAANAKKQVNLKRTSLAASTKDHIPPRLNTTLRGTIQDVYLYIKNGTSSATPNVRLTFFGNDKLDTLTPADLSIHGDEEFAQEFSLVRSGSSLFQAHVGGLSIPYVDEDDTGEFHFVLLNQASTNILTSNIEFTFLPSFPV